jgi:hypothetical protein
MLEKVMKHRHGDTREDGCCFLDYHKGKERWLSPHAYERWRVGHAVAKARRRAEKKGREFSLTVDYMMEIYPPSGLCWMTHEPMVWGLEGGYASSPSIDRLDHNLGYVPGNVSWMSLRGNQLKQCIERPYKPEGSKAQAKKIEPKGKKKAAKKAWKPQAKSGKRPLWR